jgi:acyl-homoserine lactone acylase PvdQ
MGRNVAADGTAFRCDTLPRRAGVHARFGVRRGRASNAMPIGPRLTADRHAPLPGGTQMGYSTPQIDHEIGIRGPSFDVSGVQLTGWPLIPTGSPHHVWTLTSGGTDNTDRYVEVVRLRAGAAGCHEQDTSR